MARRNKGLERKSKGQLRAPRKLFVIATKGLGLKGIARECLKRGYHFCLSNPNFEFWLLLH